MGHILFVVIFILAHTLAYILAGVIALRFSKDIYEGKERLCTFLNDMRHEMERKHVQRYFLPAQLLRGVLMAMVLLPILTALQDLPALMIFLFFFLLMFVFTHISSAAPFLDNIEGQVYFKKEYLMKRAFLKFQLEMVIYSFIFSLMMTLFMWIRY